ncbi:DUF4956 domain-containing protein [Marinisporobacter balticus]|uniref:Uncharacterized protein DUF4956 n=1 Tax=Marinisporobacter balticus TaxID=2018667 RepID=A0A4R2KC57_9FIRM|nr:DUF4956 domain-containing protein [Marinisporobacter balticus]TCO69832.1 uncharacterized protein DUF4956 [Marinisporobacter balticus]
MNNLGFQDIIKKSVLKLANFSDLSMINILIGLSITLLVSLFIFYIYKITFEGVVYSHSFNTSLVLLSLITSLVIMTISSNIVLSLGMVGALSIVRFRAAIKDPKDIVFMFWAIATGIASGAGIYTVSVGGSLFIGMVLIVMSSKKFQHSTYLLIIKYEDRVKESILPILNKLQYVLKSKTVSNQKIELTLELKRVGENTSFVETLSSIEGVDSAILVKYNGDYAE